MAREPLAEPLMEEGEKIMQGKQQGFTLVELLIVVAIISILAAVLIPNLLGAKRTASSKAAQQFGQAVSMALNTYMAARPGLTASAVMTAFGGNDCAKAYTLSGGSSSPRVTPGGNGMGGLSAWGPPPDVNTRCTLAEDTTTSSTTDFSVTTWSTRDSQTRYVNGVKQ